MADKALLYIFILVFASFLDNPLQTLLGPFAHNNDNLQSYLGNNYSVSLVQPNRRFFNNYPVQNLVSNGIQGTFDATIDSLIKYTEDEAANELNLPIETLTRQWVARFHDKAKITWHDFFDQVLHSPTDLSDPHGMRKMDVGNGLRRFKIFPTKETLTFIETLPGGKDDVESWKNVREWWRMEKLTKNMVIFVGGTPAIDAENIEVTDEFSRAVKLLFSKFDANSDEKLSAVELTCFVFGLLGRLPKTNEYTQLTDCNEELCAAYLVFLAQQHESQVKDGFIRLGFSDNFVPSEEIQSPEKITMHVLLKKAISDINRKTKEESGVEYEVKHAETLMWYMLENAIEVPETELKAMADILKTPDLVNIKRYFTDTMDGDAMHWLYVGIEYSSRTFLHQRIDNALAAWVSQNLATFEAMLYRSIPVLFQKHGYAHSNSSYSQNYASFLVSNRNEFFTNTFGQLSPKFRLKLCITLATNGAPLSTDLIYTLLEQLNVTNEEVVDIITKECQASSQVTDVVKALLYKSPLPDVLPEDLASLAPKDIDRLASEYLGATEIGNVDLYMRENKYLATDENFGEIVNADAKVLKELGVDRKALANKVLGLVLLARIRDSIARVKYMESFGTTADDILAQLAPSIEQAKKLLGEDPLKMPEDYPIQVGICVTRGHHREPFHPCFDGYYFNHDQVGGSADIVIVNKKLCPQKYTDEALEEMLSERLNAKIAPEWESQDGVVYTTDMMPYLIRIAGFFEGPKTRYRADPRKLIQVLEMT